MANDSQPQFMQHAAAAPHRINTSSVPHARPSWLSQMALFARNFAKYPSLVGWMLPSSPSVVKRVLRQVDWKNARLIVEYGPGIGTFTGEILRRMHPEATLVALEVNPDFVQFLGDSFPDSRLQLVHSCAPEVDPDLA